MPNMPAMTDSSRSATLPEDAATLRSELAAVRQQLAAERDERLSVERELEQTERELRDLLSHVARADGEHGDLLKLHVALSRLHESADRASALAGIHEVIVNVIGSEHFGLYELVEGGMMLQPFGGMGMSEAEDALVPVATTLLGRVASTGEAFLATPEFDESGLPSAPNLVACVPLRLAGTTVGVIAIYRLLPHKPALEPLDRELLELLGTHAASALAGAELRCGSARRAVAV